MPHVESTIEFFRFQCERQNYLQFWDSTRGTVPFAQKFFRNRDMPIPDEICEAFSKPIQYLRRTDTATKGTVNHVMDGLDLRHLAPLDIKPVLPGCPHKIL